MGADDNGNLGKGPVLPKLNPEDIAAEVKVVLTKSGGIALFGPLDNLPLLLQLLSEGVAIAGQLVGQVLPKRIIPVTGGLPPGLNLRGRAGE